MSGSIVQLDVTVASLAQGSRFTGHFKVKGDKIRIIIERDSYDNQSKAKAEIWDAVNKRWNEIATIDYPNMKTSKEKYNNHKESDFEADKTELLRLVNIVLE